MARAAQTRPASETGEAAEGALARSSLRLVAAFEALAKSANGMTLAELSVAIAAPKSSLLGILRAMVSAGYVGHLHGRYQLGARAFRLAADILAARSFPDLVRPVLRELHARSRETVFLVILDRAERRVTYAEGFDSPNPIRYTVPTGATRPLYCSAGGLMLLAHQEPAWIDTYLDTVALEPLTPRTTTDPARLRQRLDAIRGCGFAISVGETVPGAAGVAAPIFNSDGTVTAGLLIAAPEERFEKVLPELKRLLGEAVARIAAAG